MAHIGKINSLKGLKSKGKNNAKCPYCGKIGFRAYENKQGKRILRCKYCHNAEWVFWKP